MNKTSLSHWSVLCRIYAAMRKAVKTGISQYVYNRKGIAFMRVDYARNQPQAFKFWNNKQADCTNLVLSVLRGV